MAEARGVLHSPAARVKERIAALAGYRSHAFHVVRVFVSDEHGIDISRVCPQVFESADYLFCRKAGIYQYGTAFCHYYV